MASDKARGYRGNADLPPGPARDLADLLRRLRQRRGLSVGQIAVSAGLSRSHVSEVLRGWKTPSVAAATVIARALGASEGEASTARQWAEQVSDLQSYHRAHRTSPRIGAAQQARPAPEPGNSGYGSAVSPDRWRSPVVPRQLPIAVTNFIGRAEELRRLSGLLDDNCGVGGAMVISAIGGTAGTGKTALAVHWAHQAAGRFPDGQLYVNLRGYDPGLPVAPADVLASFLGALGMPGKDIPLTQDERASWYRSLVADRRLLVVLDNASEEEQVRPLLPGAPGCMAVVTSRSSLAGLVARDGADRIELDTFPPATAADLLSLLIGERAAADPAATAALADRCARLPLALRVAAERVISRPDVPLADLVAELADEQRRLDFLDAGSDPRTAVRAVFSWSFRHLEAAAASMFQQASAHPGTDFDVYAIAALAGTTLPRSRQLLDLLAQAHLIQPAGPNRYGMHDLLRAYARELDTAHRDDKERRASLTRMFDHYLRTAAAAMNALFPAEHHSRYQIPLPTGPAPPVGTDAQARAWLNSQRHTLVTVAEKAAVDGWPQYAVMLSGTLSYYLHGGAHYPEAIVIHGHALRAARACADQTAEAAALTCLGMIDWEQGRWRQAVARLEQARIQFHSAEDRRGEADALVGLALVDIQQGQGQQATSRLERAVALYRVEHHLPGEAHAVGDLGGLDMLQGRYERAAARLKQSMTLARQAGNRPLEAYALTRIGSLEARLGRLQQAVAVQLRALAIFREIGNRNGQAEVHFRLSRVALREERYQRAGDHADQALALFRDIGDGPGEAHTLSLLAAVDLREGRYEQAADYLERSVTLAQQTGERLVEASSLTMLGDTWQRQGRNAQADRCYQQALNLLRESGERPGQVAALNGLGELALVTQRPDEACRRYAVALDLAAKTRQTAERARAHDGLGRACLALGRPAQARRHWELAMELYTASGSPEADRLRTRLAGAYL